MKVGTYIKCDDYASMFIQQKALQAVGVETLRKLSAYGVRGYFLKVTKCPLSMQTEE